MFPNVILHFDISRESSVMAVEESFKSERKIFLVTQKDPKVYDEKNVYSMGVLATIKEILRQTDNTMRILVKGECRAQAVEFIDQNENFLKAKILKLHTKEEEKDVLDEALVRNAREVFAQYLSLCSTKVSGELIFDIANFDDAGKTADYILANISIKSKIKQSLLEEMNPISRLQKTVLILSKENEILKFKNQIDSKIKVSLEQSQREYLLREQMRAISQELGEDEDPLTEAEEFKNKIESFNLPNDTREKLLKECKNFSKIPSASPEATISRNYLEFCCSLPWNKSSRETINLDKSQKILDSDHYGLDEVKQRVMEFLAVKKLAPGVKGQIICFSGPPGVGKTSIVKSLAKALNRKYIRISLGGVSDESEIRGHRKTYIGAMPGRILSSINQVKVNNPIILLDEVDKLSKDYKGDPASALLELLDPEQNSEFHDRYLDVPFDLSKVMFIATANDKNSIPRPLYDRMEIIDLYSYTYEEKFQIAVNHLISKQLKKHGLNGKNFSITDEAVKKLIECYTKEAGVRELERQISSLMRKTAKSIVEGKIKSVCIDETKLTEMLGPEKFKSEKLSKENEVGVVNGLAWTSVGGETMPIEVALMKGKGKVQVTGLLGDVMKESAQIAVSYIRSNSEKLGICSDFYKNFDIHIHAPEGAVPKDGPSAGVSMATALVSALSKKPVLSDVAMTGEISLKGKVLPIGGLKEKTMAAYKKGIKTVIIPSGNESDIQKIDKTVKKSLKFVMADNLDTVFKNALATPLKPRNVENDKL